jgi:hypothetical protein
MRRKLRAVEHPYVETRKNSSYRDNADTFSSHDTPKTSSVVVPKLSTEKRCQSLTFSQISNKRNLIIGVQQCMLQIDIQPMHFIIHASVPKGGIPRSLTHE